MGREAGSCGVGDDFDCGEGDGFGVGDGGDGGGFHVDDGCACCRVELGFDGWFADDRRLAQERAIAGPV